MLQQLQPLLARFRANNPGPMTATGTNCYLLGDTELVLIDPGPCDEVHVEALLDACGTRLKWILATHTHCDHSPAAALLAAKTGAQIIGPRIANDDYQDMSFCPQIEVCDGQALRLGGIDLQVVATPGHVDNHVCYYWPETKMLFSGDHIMQGSSVVIIPPAGDMQAYLHSLEILLELDLDFIAPGHGELITEPHDEVRALIAHRLKREEKVLAVLQNQVCGNLDALVRKVYDDVDTNLHPIAKLSLWAHLLKLNAQERLEVDDDAVELAQKIWRFKA